MTGTERQADRQSRTEMDRQTKERRTDRKDRQKPTHQSTELKDTQGLF